MRREVIDCDRCTAKAVADPVRIVVHVGWTPCPAGGPSERDLERLDLCHRCAAALLEGAVGAMDSAAAKKWYDAARKQK